jgi:hypothetical protein
LSDVSKKNGRKRSLLEWGEALRRDMAQGDDPDWPEVVEAMDELAGEPWPEVAGVDELAEDPSGEDAGFC